MVTNYDRIFAEITKEADRVARETNQDARELLTVAMEIVDLEDQHSIHQTNVDQRFTAIINEAAIRERQSRGGERC